MSTNIEGEARQRIREQFETACTKIWKYQHMVEGDFESTLHMETANIENDRAELERLRREFSTPELIEAFNADSLDTKAFEQSIRRLEERILFNTVINEIDLMYADVLRCARLIAHNPELYGQDPERFWLELCAIGRIKTNIDETKSSNEKICGENLYPNIPRVEPLSDEDALRAFLLS